MEIQRHTSNFRELDLDPLYGFLFSAAINYFFRITSIDRGAQSDESDYSTMVIK